MCMRIYGGEKIKPKLCFKRIFLEAFGSSENTEGRIPKCQYPTDCTTKTALKVSTAFPQFCQFWTTDFPEVFETTKFIETENS